MLTHVYIFDPLTHVFSNTIASGLCIVKCTAWLYLYKVVLFWIRLNYHITIVIYDLCYERVTSVSIIL